MALQALAGHLLADSSCEAAIIDTAGSFSPLRLRDIIAHRLAAQRHAINNQVRPVHAKSTEGIIKVGEDMTEEATRMLDRVRVMRVFDFAGVVEATSEIIQIWEVHERELAEHREKFRAEHGIRSSQDEEDEDMGDLVESGGGYSDLTLDSGCITMIVIDNIANVVNEEMSKSQVQGKLLLVQ